MYRKWIPGRKTFGLAGTILVFHLGLDVDVKNLSEGACNTLHSHGEIGNFLFVAPYYPFSIKSPMDFWVAYDGSLTQDVVLGMG